MALRLRRGTDAERLLITPVEGELIYTTDTKLLYAGDGSTAGGNVVTGSGGGGATTLDALTDTDLTGAADNDVLTFNAGTNKWESVAVPGVGALALTDLTNVNTGGLETWDILQYDGINFVPKSIDEALVTDADGSITINTAGTHTGNVVGNVDGDVTGSVFGDDSSILVDGVNNTITAASLNTNSIQAVGDTSIILENAFRTPLQIKTITDGDLGGFPYTEYLSIKGTFDNPLSLEASDIVGGWKITGYDSVSGDGKVSALWISSFESDAVVTDNYPKSSATLLISKGGDTYNQFMFGSEGEFKAPGAITPGVFADAAARDAGITTPTAGMMVFVTDVAKFQGYDGSAWVNLN